MKTLYSRASILLLIVLWCLTSQSMRAEGIKRAEDYGFSIWASSTENCDALNRALEGGGHVLVSTPGTYRVAGTLYIDSDTELEFAPDVIIRRQYKVNDCAYNFIQNRHAADYTYDQNITIRGLNLDVTTCQGSPDASKIIGLQGVIAFFYVRNLIIDRLHMTNIPGGDFGLQVCTFDGLKISNSSFSGHKDGIHLGRGRNFRIEHCTFATNDDAIALNGHDYVKSQPEIGWLEDGTIEDCTDLNENGEVGFFARMLAGSWTDWHEGMELRYGDAVVSEGRIYRFMNLNDTIVSLQQPTHQQGTMTYDDGSNWLMQQQNDITYTAGVRNVGFYDIRLQKSRAAGFSFHLDHDSFSRSFYPKARPIVQSGFTLHNIRQETNLPIFASFESPVDSIRISSCEINNRIRLKDIGVEGCVYDTAVFLLSDVKTSLEEPLFYNVGNYPYKELQVRKLVTIGDSQTSLCGWQPTVVEETGYEWSRQETVTGVNGHRHMAYGGIKIRPNQDNCILLNSLDAHYYTPTAIILYAGQNDLWGQWVSDSDSKLPYDEMVRQVPAYLGDTVNANIMTLAAYKGMIEQLQSSLPDATIYLMTHVPVLCVIGMNPTEEFSQYYPSPRFATMDDVIRFEKYNRQPKDDVIRALGRLYDLPVIDLWRHSGINYYNTSEYYGTPAGDCTQVHLNKQGEAKIAACIAEYLNNAPTHHDDTWIPSGSPEKNDPVFSETIINHPFYNLQGFRVDCVKDVSELEPGLYVQERKKILIETR